MQHPINDFKRALVQGHTQLGLWQALGNPYSTDLCAGTGYDWLLIDGEHAPNTVTTILAQLQAMAGHTAAPVVRAAWNDPVELKHLLDIGAQNLLIPMVQDADQARAAVSAVHYPPHGSRGVGTALARAARWGAKTDYLARANDEICLLCQTETIDALSNIEDIAGVEGVDGIFIGPADLAASMGHIGNPGHPDVIAAIEDAIPRIRAAGVAAGLLQTDIAQAKHYIQLGAQFVAVAVDTVLLRRAATDVLAHFKDDVKTEVAQPGAAY